MPDKGGRGRGGQKIEKVPYVIKEQPLILGSILTKNVKKISFIFEEFKSSFICQYLTISNSFMFGPFRHDYLAAQKNLKKIRHDPR